MRTEDVKTVLQRFGLNDQRFTTHPSMSHDDGTRGLASPTVVESFTAHAPDGSEFLITIMRLRKGEGDE